MSTVALKRRNSMAKIIAVTLIVAAFIGLVLVVSAIHEIKDKMEEAKNMKNLDANDEYASVQKEQQAIYDSYVPRYDENLTMEGKNERSFD
jgi:predicted PurR-regulated permease PerM